MFTDATHTACIEGIGNLWSILEIQWIGSTQLLSAILIIPFSQKISRTNNIHVKVAKHRFTNEYNEKKFPSKKKRNYELKLLIKKRNFIFNLHFSSSVPLTFFLPFTFICTTGNAEKIIRESLDEYCKHRRLFVTNTSRCIVNAVQEFQGIIMRCYRRTGLHFKMQVACWNETLLGYIS